MSRLSTKQRRSARRRRLAYRLTDNIFWRVSTIYASPLDVEAAIEHLRRLDEAPQVFYVSLAEFQRHYGGAP